MILRFLWPAILWSIIVLVLTLIPGENLPEVGIFQIDKLVHIFIFGMMMVLTSFGLKKLAGISGRPDYPGRVSAIYTLSFGIGVEVLQIFVPGRNFSLADVVANCIGVGLGYFIFSVGAKNKKRDASEGQASR